MRMLLTAFYDMFSSERSTRTEINANRNCAVEQLVALWGVVKPSYTTASDIRLLSCRSDSPGTMQLSGDDSFPANSQQ